jgi:hypothetical protein
MAPRLLDVPQSKAPDQGQFGGGLGQRLEDHFFDLRSAGRQLVPDIDVCERDNAIRRFAAQRPKEAGSYEDSSHD